ncbi:hypothetical protein [Streptosporangium sp. NPDC087985]
MATDKDPEFDLLRRFERYVQSKEDPDEYIFEGVFDVERSDDG